jgi:hypothetical protein
LVHEQRLCFGTGFNHSTLIASGGTLVKITAGLVAEIAT